MQVAITQDILSALATMDHVPDNLKARFAAVAQGEGGLILKLTEDEAMALAELANWYIGTDPATGQPKATAGAFGELVRLIDEAQFG